MIDDFLFSSFRPVGTVVTVRWFKYDLMGVAQPIATSEKYVRSDKSRRLEINKPTYEYDNGKFLCVTYADNEQKDTKDVYLDVFGEFFYVIIINIIIIIINSQHKPFY